MNDRLIEVVGNVGRTARTRMPFAWRFALILTLFLSGALTSRSLGDPIYFSSIATNFNGTAISGGNYIWFNSVINPGPFPTAPGLVHLYIVNSTISFTDNGTTYNLTTPDATISFDPNATSGSTSFDTTHDTWLTTLPKTFSSNVFMDGLAFQVPSGGLDGGIKNVTWSANFLTDHPGGTLQWQWAAAVYQNGHFSTDYNALGVKPLLSTTLDSYHNGDHAGTPENYADKNYVLGGATGGGSSNFTGSYSSTATVTPLPTPSALWAGIVLVGGLFGMLRVRSAFAH